MRRSLEGYDVCEAGDGATALSAIAERSPDLLLLDHIMGAEDGLDVLTRLRRQSDVPVILLTGIGDEGERVLSLKLGADDYVVKPFSPAETVARISTVLRRVRPGPPTSRLEFDGLVLDAGSRELLVAGALVEATPKEFDLLFFLASSPRQVFSREQLLDHVWRSSSEWQDPATVTEHIRRSIGTSSLTLTIPAGSRPCGASATASSRRHRHVFTTATQRVVNSVSVDADHHCMTTRSFSRHCAGFVGVLTVGLASCPP